MKKRDEMELKLEKQIGYPYYEIVEAETYITNNERENFVKCSECGHRYLIDTKEYLDRQSGKTVIFLCPKCRKK